MHRRQSGAGRARLQTISGASAEEGARLRPGSLAFPRKRGRGFDDDRVDSCDKRKPSNRQLPTVGACVPHRSCSACRHGPSPELKPTRKASLISRPIQQSIDARAARDALAYKQFPALPRKKGRAFGQDLWRFRGRRGVPSFRISGASAEAGARLRLGSHAFPRKPERGFDDDHVDSCDKRKSGSRAFSRQQRRAFVHSRFRGRDALPLVMISCGARCFRRYAGTTSLRWFRETSTTHTDVLAN